MAGPFRPSRRRYMPENNPKQGKPEDLKPIFPGGVPKDFQDQAFLDWANEKKALLTNANEVRAAFGAWKRMKFSKRFASG